MSDLAKIAPISARPDYGQTMRDPAGNIAGALIEEWTIFHKKWPLMESGRSKEYLKMSPSEIVLERELSHARSSAVFTRNRSK